MVIIVIKCLVLMFLAKKVAGFQIGSPFVLSVINDGKNGVVPEHDFSCRSHSKS